MAEAKEEERPEERTIFCWGFGKYGQQGDGNNESRDLPHQMIVDDRYFPAFVSCGAHYTLVALELKAELKGPIEKRRYSSYTPRVRCTVHTCGWGKYGRLGNGSEQDQNVLKPVCEPSTRELDGLPIDVESASAGHWHACLVTKKGKLYSWGYNKSHGVLGMGERQPNEPVFEPIPRQVPTSISFTSVSCGFNYTLAISKELFLYSWGCNRYGTLGLGHREDRYKPTFVQIINDRRVSSVSAGYAHMGLILTNGTIYTCGKGSDGALGHGYDLSDKLYPTIVEALIIPHGFDISCSPGEHHAHTVCATDRGVYTWGDGYKGKLGHGDQESKVLPTLIPKVKFNGHIITAVACGGLHSVALCRHEVVFTWGCGSDGRLGHPEAVGHRYLYQSNEPKEVELPRKWRPFSISCSYYHTTVTCYASSDYFECDC